MKNSALSLLIALGVNGLLLLALIRLNRHDEKITPPRTAVPAPVIMRALSLPEPTLVAPAPPAVREITPPRFTPPLTQPAWDHLPPLPAPVTVMIPQPPPTPVPPPGVTPAPNPPVTQTVPTPETVAKTDAGPYDVNDIDTPPRGIGNRPPRYPEIARRRNIEGSVTVKLLIDKTGHVKQSEILDVEGHPAFRQAVLRMVKTWRFTVPMYQGRPVDVWAVKTIKFQLN